MPNDNVLTKPRDAIARSKRILALVDEYHENPTRDTRTVLRVALMDEFQPEPRAEVTFSEWFEREYPMGDDGSRPKYRATNVLDLMISAWNAARTGASS